jgi:hypothetical protein
MADFIPGEAYRLDIVGADESTIVDSWQGVIKADVVSNEGLIQVDVSTGKLYGPLVGDIHDPEGNVVYNSSERLLKADISGSVYDNSGATKLIDGIAGKITGPVYGNVVDSEGTSIVDAVNRTVTAQTFTGDLYGDVYGSITSEGVIYGTFSGDFNGTSYGEFFGNSVGEHTGDVIGDVTGNVTGVVFGRLDGTVTVTWTEEEGPVPLHGWNPQFNQHEFLGGIGSPHMPAEGETARGPVLIVGENREETALRANVIHYNGQEIIKLHTEIDPAATTAPATIRGQLEGTVIWEDPINECQDVLSCSAQGTVLHAVNGVVTIGGYITDAIDCDVNIFADAVTVETSADEEFLNVKKYNGTVNAKTAVSTDNPLAIISGEGYNGSDFVTGGLFGIYADAAPTDTYVESKFVVSLPKGNDNHDHTNPRRLSFDGDGVLTVPVFKARGTTFADRDSMIAEAGMIIFNVNTSKFQGFTGSNWVDLH